MAAINVVDVAAQLGEPVENVVRTLKLCRIGHAHNIATGERWLTPSVARQIIAIYENARGETVQKPRPTPENLREEFTAEERAAIREDTPEEHF